VPEQLTLFSYPSPAPEGLRYQPDFFSERDDHELVSRIRSLPLEPFQFGAFEGKRRVASFGWRYDYSQQKLKEAEDLPTWITPVVARVETWGSLPIAAIRQVLFTEYDAGTGIGWHRDKPHFDQVFGLSLSPPASSGFVARRKTAGSVSLDGRRGGSCISLKSFCPWRTMKGSPSMRKNTWSSGKSCLAGSAASPLSPGLPRKAAATPLPATP